MSDYNILSDLGDHANDPIENLHLSSYMLPWLDNARYRTIGDVAQVLNACPNSVFFSACHAGGHTITELVYKIGRYAASVNGGGQYTPGATDNAGGHSGGAGWSEDGIVKGEPTATKPVKHSDWPAPGGLANGTVETVKHSDWPAPGGIENGTVES